MNRASNIQAKGNERVFFTRIMRSIRFPFAPNHPTTHLSPARHNLSHENSLHVSICLIRSHMHSAEIGRMIAEWSAALKESLITGALNEYRSLRDRMSLLIDLRRQVRAGGL